MKRLFSLLLALVMIVGCVAMFASCAKETPNEDYDDAKKALEDADYSVTASDEDLAPGQEAYIYAYDEDHDNYIYIYWCEDISYAKLMYDNLKFEYEMEVEETKRYIKFCEKYLKMYEDDMKSDEIDEYEDNIKEAEEWLEELEEDYVIGRKGKMVWKGTVKAIKATK